MTRTTTAPTEGRRELNMRRKHERIRNAAADLFDTHGFDAVTTQAIADAADVAAGTVFRYAASKSELLLMVYNERLGHAIAAGTTAACAETDPIRAVNALLDPMLDEAHAHPENAVAYQRELLFGDPLQEYRALGLAQIADLEETIARLLLAGGDHPRSGADQAAAAIFAASHLVIARLATGAHPGRSAVADLHHQVELIVTGWLALHP
ncbi:TetR/AcrR family transcriptional regulator [Nocardioides sp.]|uniref:TetR/AcrR family transcriptional regulator n=1 Tax=Nocardioides sp. TaxID=35761 RepID=UPI00260A1979|nr:TetR/AcrR family transcriptional regulator [Nocardioides sp.]